MSPSEQDWEAYKDTIHHLFLEFPDKEGRENAARGSTTKEIAEHMKNEYGFVASQGQYSTRMKGWGFRKNLNQQEKDYVLHRKRKRDAAGKSSQVVWNGSRLPEAKVKKLESRCTISELVQIDAVVAGPPTPQGIVVNTPQPATPGAMELDTASDIVMENTMMPTIHEVEDMELAARDATRSPNNFMGAQVGSRSATSSISALTQSLSLSSREPEICSSPQNAESVLLDAKQIARGGWDEFWKSIIQIIPVASERQIIHDSENDIHREYEEYVLEVSRRESNLSLIRESRNPRLFEVRTTSQELKTLVFYPGYFCFLLEKKKWVYILISFFLDQPIAIWLWTLIEMMISGDYCTLTGCSHKITRHCPWGRVLLEADIARNVFYDDRQRILHAAFTLESSAIVNYLLDHEIPDIAVKDQPMIEKFRDSKAIRLLHKKGYDFKEGYDLRERSHCVSDGTMQTPMERYLRQQNMAVVGVLLDIGIKFDNSDLQLGFLNAIQMRQLPLLDKFLDVQDNLPSGHDDKSDFFKDTIIEFAVSIMSAEVESFEILVRLLSRSGYLKTAPISLSSLPLTKVAEDFDKSFESNLQDFPLSSYSNHLKLYIEPDFWKSQDGSTWSGRLMVDRDAQAPVMCKSISFKCQPYGNSALVEKLGPRGIARLLYNARNIREGPGREILLKLCKDGRFDAHNFEELEILTIFTDIMKLEMEASGRRKWPMKDAKEFMAALTSLCPSLHGLVDLVPECWETDGSENLTAPRTDAGI